MAVITVPHNIDKSGKITVLETTSQIESQVEAARRARRQFVVLHRKHGGEEFRIRWSLIQATERGGQT